jgi:hypothetical protein
VHLYLRGNISAACGGFLMATLNELLADQKRLEGLVVWLENKDRLSHDGLNALGKARADLWAVKEQIAARTV